MQDLYRNEGVVVKGDVVDCYCVDDDNSEGYGVGVATYRTVVSYVVPRKVVSGGRETLFNDFRKENCKRRGKSYAFEANKGRRAMKNVNRVSMSDNGLPAVVFPEAVHKLSSKVPEMSKDEMNASDTDPKMIRNCMPLEKVNVFMSETIKNDTDRGLDMVNGSSTSLEDYSNNRSLLDSVSKSFETPLVKLQCENQNTKPAISDKDNCKHIKISDVTERSNTNIGIYEEERSERKINEGNIEQDPEQIGNCLEIFGISHFLPIQKPKTKVIKDLGPVRVKKRFETNDFLYPGKGNVEILVLPGNPTSGILKSEFDEHEIMLDCGTGTSSEQDYVKGNNLDQHQQEMYLTAQVDEGEQERTDQNNDEQVLSQRQICKFNVDSKSYGNSYMDQFTTAAIGVVLAAVSTIGAVNAALKLPYNARAFGWFFVVTSLTFMWPLAMLTYKTVHRLRIYMMNKIISFEPCAEKTGLYDLSKLPTVGLNCSSSKLNTLASRAGALVQESDYFIMVDSSPMAGEKKKGVFSQDEDSAISSLSGDGRLRRIV